MAPTSNFYDQLISKFSDIYFPKMYEDLSIIGKHLVWYLADSQSNYVGAKTANGKYVFELDIQAAFPTICNALYDPNSDFIKHMNQIEAKKSKNIFIATTLKGEPLKVLNNICKTIILGIVFDTTSQSELETINIFEIKKDGCVFTGTEETYHRLTRLYESNQTFTNFVVDHNFQFHFDVVSSYTRCNKTTMILNQNSDELKIKGAYHNYPPGLEPYMLKTIKNELNDSDVDELLKIYSVKYLNILRNNNLLQLLQEYYLCNNNKIITSGGQYESYRQNISIDPRNYLRYFIFPGNLLMKIN